MVKLVKPRYQNPLSHRTSVLLPYSSYNSYLKNIKKKYQHKLRNGGVTVLWNKWNTCPICSTSDNTWISLQSMISLVEMTFCSGILLKCYPVILSISTNHHNMIYNLQSIKFQDKISPLVISSSSYMSLGIRGSYNSNNLQTIRDVDELNVQRHKFKNKKKKWTYIT